jgi:hypothetical protein
MMRARTYFPGRHRGARMATAIAVAGTAMAIGSPGGILTGDATDRFVSGSPVTERTPVAADRAASTLALAAAFRSRLGLPEPAVSRVERVVDRFDGTAYDEVTASDREGQALHLERFDAGGRLIGAVAFGWQAAGGTLLPNAEAARARGNRLAADLGLGPTGTPDVRQGPDDTGWTLTWPRIVDGVPVPGDGVRVELWPDGRMHAIVRTERSLAARPSVTLDQATARGRATATLRAMFGSSSGGVRIASLGLAWVAPNSAFDPAGPDAPGATLRLAWVVEARTSGELADGLRAVKLFLDAGSGTLIGGDVLR